MLFFKDGLGDSNIPTQETGKASPAAILKILLWVVWVPAIDLWVGGEGKKGKQGKGGWVTLLFFLDQWFSRDHHLEYDFYA